MIKIKIDHLDTPVSFPALYKKEDSDKTIQKKTVRLQTAFDKMLSATILQANEIDYEAAKLELWKAFEKNTTYFTWAVRMIRKLTDTAPVVFVTIK